MGTLPALAAPTGPYFYTVKEVAEIVRVSVHTVYRAIEDGDLPALRFRGRVVVSAKAVQCLIEFGHAEPADVSAPDSCGAAAPELRAGLA